MALAAAAAGAVALGVSSASGATADGSLYSGPGPRPGPDLLYEAPATAPQLTNAGVWKAQPILVSGASAYRGGEFLYQDFLYDDHGAAGVTDPQDPMGGDTFSSPTGTATYPSAAAYADNAADLVEFRVKPLSDSTAFRVTLNTMNDPSLVAFSVALGGSDGTTYPFPDGANVRAPADLFLTVHPSGSGMVASLERAASGAAVSGPAPSVSVDTTRRQIEVRVPHGEWNPGTSVVRMALGVGLWDEAAGRYLAPQATRDATHPGGAVASASPPAFFNVGFRSNGQEPMPSPSDLASQTTRPSWWREREQAAALATGDISEFHANVDFAKLAKRVDDESGVPATGPMDRILASHFALKQGIDWSVSCFPQSDNGGTSCPGQLQGNLQPYAIYVPREAQPASGYGMTLLLHSLAANYNQYLSSRNQWQFGERGTGSIVITPEGRGPDGFYDSYAGADTFEVWADVAQHYRLNPDWAVITGYSMGGFGTFKLASEFPDLFAKAQPTVGRLTHTELAPSLRNVPVLMWNASTDELVPESSFLPTAKALDDAGYRYELDIFAPAEHLTLAINDQYDQAAAFLGTDTVDRNPAHVTYVVDPALDYPQLGFVADHAYWLSGLRSANGAEGTVDAFSHGFGAGDPVASPTQVGAGTLTGGTIPTIAYSRQYKTWGPAPAAPKLDVLDLRATGITAATVAVARAHLDCSATLNVTTDTPIDVTLAGCNKTLHFGANATSAGVLPPLPALPTAGGSTPAAPMPPPPVPTP